MNGKIAFGFINPANFEAPELDPRIAYFSVHTQTFDYSAGRYNDLKSIELTNINQNDHPEYFYKGS